MHIYELCCMLMYVSDSANLQCDLCLNIFFVIFMLPLIGAVLKSVFYRLNYTDLFVCLLQVDPICTDRSCTVILYKMHNMISF